jgi:hypothetical protein
MKCKLLLGGLFAACLLSGCGAPTLTKPHGDWVELNPPVVLTQDSGDLQNVDKK